MKTQKESLPGYAEFVSELKERITSARINVARAVTRDHILLYWDIGKGIVEKQKTRGWGDSVVEVLARDLRREIPSAQGFSPDNLWRMRQFYTEYSSMNFLEQIAQELNLLRSGKSEPPSQQRGILEQPVPERAAIKTARSTSDTLDSLLTLLCQVPWGHNVEILKKIKLAHARLFYLTATVRFGWSRNVLLNQIKAKAYERSFTADKSHNFPAALPIHLAEQAEEALKSSYNLGFLGIGRAVRERELENRLLEQVRDFILELGYGFCFIGNQYRLTLGRKEYFIDLLFYHRFLKALVAIELKVGPFEPEFAGKMDFYLNLLNEKEKAEDDNPSIGIILCAEKDTLEVEFSLKTKTNPIGVAEYHLTQKLPKEFKGKLPSENELRGLVRTVKSSKEG